jgi:K+ transporter
VLREARRRRLLPVLTQDVSYFLGWHLVRALPRTGWLGLKLRLFARMQRRSAQAAEFFRMPTRRVIVLATDVEL